MRRDFRRAATIGIVGFILANAVFWTLSQPAAPRVHGHASHSGLDLPEWFVADHGVVPTRAFDAQTARLQPARLRTNAEDLQRTDVTAVLDTEITPGRNLIWCGSFQLAWNELRPSQGRPVMVEPGSALVASLNNSAFGWRDVNLVSTIVAAGAAAGTLDVARNALKERFPQLDDSDLLLPTWQQLGPGPVVYAFLFRFLPFQWAFDRPDYLPFGDERVASFGINQLDLHNQAESRMARQVKVLDWAEGSGFVVELKTTLSDDRVLLAMVPPQRTLAATVENVQRRIRSGAATDMREMESLNVPVLDFDILRRYPELEGRRIVGGQPLGAGLPITLALQRIRFRLDESGAVLLSESLMYRGGGDRDFSFWEPFLVMLRRAGSGHPYFAAWVANTEIMIPVPERGQDLPGLYAPIPHRAQ